MELANLQQTYHSSFHYGIAELVYSDPNYSSPLPVCDDETDRRVNQPEKTCAEILSELGHGIWNFLKEGLKVVGIYHPVTNYFYPELYQSDVAEMNSQFADSLTSIGNAKEKTTEAKKEINEIAEVRTTELDEKKLLLTLKKIEQEAHQLRGTTYKERVASHLAAAISILNASTTEDPTVKEWSEVSLLLDTISTIWKKALPENASLQQQRITKIIDYIQRYCRLKAGVPAYEKITGKLAQLHFDEWKLGRSNTEIYSGGLGVATPFSACGVSARISVTGAKDKIKQTDPEGYYTEYEYGRGGIEGELKAELSLGIAELKTSLVASAQGIYGGFREWKTSMAYATRELKTLLKDSKHRTDPDIAPYLSRARLVASDLGTQAAPDADSNLLDTFDEVLEVPQLKRDFDLSKEEMEQALSLYLSSLAPEKINTYTSSKTSKKDKAGFVENLKNYSDKPFVTAAPVTLPTGEVVEADVTGFVAKLVVGTESKVGGSLGSESIDLAAFSVHGTGEWMERNRKEKNKSPIGKRFMDLTKSKNKNSIKQEVEARFDVFKDVLIKTLEKESDAYQSSFTELGFEVLNMARNSRAPQRKDYQTEKLYLQAVENHKKNRVRDEEFSQFLKKNNLDQDLVKLCDMHEMQRRNLILRTPGLGSTRQITDRKLNDETNFKAYFDYLKKDFIEYTKLQNGLLGGKYDNPAQKQKAEKMAREFEACYGAETPKQLIQRMVYANVYLITHSEDNQLIEDLLEFEQKLLSSPFADEDCYFIEDAHIKITDIKLELKAKASLPFITGMTKSVFKASVAYNKLEHTNEIRTGESINFAITIGGEINIKSAVDSIASEIYQHIPGKFAEVALAQWEKELHLIEPTGSFGLERTFTWNFAKPDVYSEDGSIFSLSKYYYRETESTTKKVGGKLAIPLGVCDLVVGAEYSNNKIGPLKDECGSNTVFQLGVIFQNAVHIGAINKTTGVIEKGSRYDLYMKEQNESFKQLCINYGKECDGKTGGPISRELKAIEEAIDKNNTNYLNQLLVIYKNALNAARAASDNVTADKLVITINHIEEAVGQKTRSNQFNKGELKKFNFANARLNFEKAAQKFNSDSSEDAWNCFNNLMLAYYPQWIERKTGSACYTPRPIAEVEDASLMLKARIQQSQLKQAA